MNQLESLEKVHSPLEIYKSYIAEKADTRFATQIEKMTPLEKENWSKVELIICIPVHAIGDIECEIAHTIDRILLRKQTLERSKIGIVVYANCAESELTDPIKSTNQRNCFSDLEGYSKYGYSERTKPKIQVLYEVRKENMTIGGIRKVCNDHAINLIRNLNLDREIAILNIDADVVKITGRCLELTKKAIEETVNALLPTITIYSNGEKPKEYNPRYIGARLFFNPPLSRSISLTSLEINNSFFEKSQRESEMFPSEGFLGFLASRYSLDGGFDSGTSMLEGQQLAFGRNDWDTVTEARIKQIDVPVIVDPRRVYSESKGNWETKFWDNGQNGSDARNIRLEENPNDREHFQELIKQGLIKNMFTDILNFNSLNLDSFISKFNYFNIAEYSGKNLFKNRLINYIIEDFFIWGD